MANNDTRTIVSAQVIGLYYQDGLLLGFPSTGPVDANYNQLYVKESILTTEFVYPLIGSMSYPSEGQAYPIPETGS